MVNKTNCLIMEKHIIILNDRIIKAGKISCRNIIIISNVVQKKINFCVIAAPSQERQVARSLSNKKLSRVREAVIEEGASRGTASTKPVEPPKDQGQFHAVRLVLCLF